MINGVLDNTDTNIKQDILFMKRNEQKVSILSAW